jgi:prefoldin alpha subunit|tara:strand:+ start:519 stop:941 length:423 start_codon:yes stop_codon:yes gene_type:complete
MKNEDKLQKLYVEFQTLNNSIKQLEQQNEALESQLMELMMTNQGLEDMDKIKSDTEILVPVSSGIYAKAQIKDSKNFLVNVGSGVTLNKDLDSTKKIIENQVDEIRKLQQNLMKELQDRTSKAAVLEGEMKKLASALESK